MPTGLITPPAGFNLRAINGIAPDIRLCTILVGSLPFVFCVVVALVPAAHVLLFRLSVIATWMMGVAMGPSL